MTASDQIDPTFVDAAGLRSIHLLSLQLTASADFLCFSGFGSNEVTADDSK